MKPLFFEAPADFRRWLEAHHATSRELLVGFHKKRTGKRSLTWPESVDEALCFGWIDGVRRSLGEASYVIRFTPRKAKSVWSAVNIRRMEALLPQGRVSPAGRRAFAARDEERSKIYSYERRRAARLDSASEKALRTDRAAWRFFQAQPPWYRRTASWWVTSAKKEETRQRRLRTLVECSARGEAIRELRRPGAKAQGPPGAGQAGRLSTARRPRPRRRGPPRGPARGAPAGRARPTEAG